MVNYTMKIESKQVWKEKILDFDPDSSPIAWEHYEKYYNYFSFTKLEESLEKDKTGEIIYRLKSTVSVDEIKYEIAGDCSFNFNEDKKKSFIDIINKDDKSEDEYKKKVKDKLEQVSKMHHTLMNFSLIPVTGGLNNLKGKLKIKDNRVMVHGAGKPPKNDQLDRLDTFIYFIDYSFKKIEEFNESQYVNLKTIGEFFSNSIFTTSMKSENFSVLYDLLEKYEDVHEYCRNFYKIDNKEFVGKLIDNGKYQIKTAEDVEKYMNLAYEFWEIKKQSLIQP